MPVDWKARAVEQWTNDPCGPEADSASSLLRARRDYAPWMASVLDYAGARDLDVLDVGCGQGIDLCEYALAGARATGIDITPRHLELARSHLAELAVVAHVVRGDAEQLPFSNDSFDRVSSNGVLHHTPDMPAALSEIRRVLRPGGWATIIVYNRNSWHFWGHQVLERGLLRGELLREGSMTGVLYRVEKGAGRPLVRVYSARQVRRMMEGAGLRNVTTRVSEFRKGESRLGTLLGAARHGWYVIGQGLK
jgi:ubiquinone/menaquinone biosynthesis C-methylase UbiE